MILVIITPRIATIRMAKPVGIMTLNIITQNKTTSSIMTLHLMNLFE
jgi:hypothetical protein